MLAKLLWKHANFQIYQKWSLTSLYWWMPCQQMSLTCLLKTSWQVSTSVFSSSHSQTEPVLCRCLYMVWLLKLVMRSGTLWSSGLITTPPCLMGHVWHNIYQPKQVEAGHKVPRHILVSPIVEFDAYINWSWYRSGKCSSTDRKHSRIHCLHCNLLMSKSSKNPNRTEQCGGLESIPLVSMVG